MVYDACGLLFVIETPAYRIARFPVNTWAEQVSVGPVLAESVHSGHIVSEHERFNTMPITT